LHTGFGAGAAVFRALFTVGMLMFAALFRAGPTNINADAAQGGELVALHRHKLRSKTAQRGALNVQFDTFPHHGDILLL